MKNRRKKVELTDDELVWLDALRTANEALSDFGVDDDGEVLQYDSSKEFPFTGAFFVTPMTPEKTKQLYDYKRKLEAGKKKSV
jgi:hypothetical protein